MTFAQKARSVLMKNEIASSVIKLPPRLSESGCGWGLRLDETDTGRAKEILTLSALPYKRIIGEERV